MKKNEVNEIRSKTIDELTNDLKRLRKEIVELSHEIKMGKSTASALLRTKKKNVARLLTIIGQMRLNPVMSKDVEKKTVKKTKKEENMEIEKGDK